jgi:competence protein ComEC
MWLILLAGFSALCWLMEYRKQSVKVFNSAINGFTAFQKSVQAIKIKTFREDLASYWYHPSFIH